MFTKILSQTSTNPSSWNHLAFSVYVFLRLGGAPPAPPARGGYTGIGGMFTKILSQKKEESMLQSDKDKNKPWLLW
jgi:hypothetical protein